MTDVSEYTPPDVWVWNKESGGRFAAINRPTAGPTHDKDLPVGKHPFQLYSLATPNGVKVTVMFEELLAAGHKGAEYDAWLVPIQGDQFGSGFVAANPNSKIPALIDPRRSIKIPRCSDPARSCCTWRPSSAHSCRLTKRSAPNACHGSSGRSGAAPYLGGGFGHFYAYAPSKIRPAIDRFAMEVKRQLDVLDQRPAAGRISGRRRLPPRRYGGVAIVQGHGQGPPLRRRGVPAGAGVQAPDPLGRPDRAPSGGEARADGQLRLGRTGSPAA